MSAKRALQEKEILRLIAQDKARKLNDAAKKAIEWPGDENMELLAEAVNNRSQSVTFENGQVFSIRYGDERKMVFVSPIEPSKFVPCGYFEYDKLKGVLA